MERPVFHPDTGDGASVPTLTPRQARKHFEFFKVGSHREVILLGELVEQRVHYVRSKNHKVLCSSRLGACALCEKAGESDDVSDLQVEYYGAAFVRLWLERERHFCQRVAVFTAVAGENVLRLVTEGSLRGHRFEITRPTSQQFKVKHLAGPPRGLSSIVPPEFDLLPFIRARFGKAQDPARPLQFLAAIHSRDLVSGPVGKPRPLDVTAADCVESPEELLAIAAKFEAAGEAPKLAAMYRRRAEEKLGGAIDNAKRVIEDAAAKPVEREPIELSHAEHAAISGVVKGRIRERFKVVPPEGPSVLGDVLGSIVPPGRNGQHRRAEGGGT